MSWCHGQAAQTVILLVCRMVEAALGDALPRGGAEAVCELLREDDQLGTRLPPP